jgi:hypothetical protein
VAAWLSEKVLRGRGAMLVGSNSTEGGGFFPGHGCVCMSLGADGRVVEGRINTPVGKGAYGCINVVVYVCECEVEWAGWSGKVPRSPVASPEAKNR